MEKFNQVSIVIKSWKNLPFLQKCVESLRKNSKHELEICVGIDGPDSETEAWLKEQKDIKYVILPEHKGICTVTNEACKLSTRKYLFIVDDDNLFAPDYDVNMEAYLNEMNVLTPVQIEPGNKPVSPYLVEADCGKSLETFNEELFIKKAKEISNGGTTSGINYPIVVSKELFFKVGALDEIFNKSACNDPDLFYRLVNAGAKCLRVLDSVVYHFQGRTQAKKGEEYAKDEIRSIRDFIRKWGEPFIIAGSPDVRYSFGSECRPGVKVPVKDTNIKLSLVILTNNDEKLIYEKLQNYEPLFDEVVIVDDCSKDNTVQEIKKYITDQLGTSLLFKEDKVKFYLKNLNGDFSSQRNFANSKCTGDWIFQLDSDELIDQHLFQNLRSIIYTMDGNKECKTLGIPRINLLDGQKTPVYPDVQFRLNRKGVKWLGKVHEIPETVYLAQTNQNAGNSVAVLGGVHFIHPKTSEEQAKQNELYRKLTKEQRGKIKKVIYDSVVYTTEGITEHARQEMINLNKLGYEIFITNDYPRNADKFNQKLWSFFKPFDVVKDDYYTVINQPPVRWQRSYGLKNLFGYLAFEGNLQDDWVEIINKSPILELWTPSNYCKTRFEDSGVKKKIRVVPHGVDGTIWKPTKHEKFKEFTFLWTGTTHNTRKGYDLAIKAFSEEFKDDKNVRLVLKVNKIYKPNQNLDDLITRNIYPNGNGNVEILEEELNENQFSELMNKSHVLLHPHRCEGFGMNIMNAMAVGIPVIATNFSGNTDFCKEDNCLLVEREENLRWSPLEYPYMNAKWCEPDYNDLKKKMRLVYSEYQKYADNALNNSVAIREEHSWENVAKKIDEILQEY